MKKRLFLSLLGILISVLSFSKDWALWVKS